MTRLSRPLGAFMKEGPIKKDRRKTITHVARALYKENIDKVGDQ